jgi:uncharacterized peroxidase-related enzyme
MARIEPLPESELPDVARPVLEFARATMGFAPNDVLTMARWPEMLQAMMPVVGTLFSPGTVGMELKHMVALITSTASGCQYCVAHNAFGLSMADIAAEKREAIWEYATHPLFSPAEKAALNFARAVGQSPNGLTDAEYAELEQHFDERQIMELAGVTCLFGFLNRWNSTFQTPLEAAPLETTTAMLGASGWGPGDHA